MKDSEFIELLNLYLDHEITAADAARLEAEVQKNAAHRQRYQQYCRMQKACKVLAADFQTEEAAAAANDKKVVAFDPAAARAAAGRRTRTPGFYVASGLIAAAACVALIFAKRETPATATRDNGAVAAQPMVAAPAKATTIAAKPAAPTLRGGMVSVAAARDAHQPALVEPLLLGDAQTSATFTSTRQDTAHQFAWIEKMQLPPLQTRTTAQDLRFDTQPAVLRPDARTLGSNRVQSDNTMESVAWRINLGR